MSSSPFFTAQVEPLCVFPACDDLRLYRAECVRVCERRGDVTPATKGEIPSQNSLLSAFRIIVRDYGVMGLLSGARPHVIWFALFAATGFSFYELCKSWMIKLQVRVSVEGDNPFTSAKHYRALAICRKNALAQ